MAKYEPIMMKRQLPKIFALIIILLSLYYTTKAQGCNDYPADKEFTFSDMYISGKNMNLDFSIMMKGTIGAKADACKN